MGDRELGAGRRRRPGQRRGGPLTLAATAAAVLALAAAAAAPGHTAAPSGSLLFGTSHLSHGNVVGPTRIYSIRPDGTGRRFLALGNWPAWSPDRRRIAFARAGIWVMNAGGGGQRRLTRGATDVEPAWSPDGRQIVFRALAPEGTFDLHVVPAAGGTARALLRTPKANEWSPDWSPDGKRVAYEGDRGPSIQIWALTLATHTSLPLTHGANSFSPAYSPDGRRLAFARDGQIYVARAGGGGAHAIGSGPSRTADDPTWSPDSSRIAFSRNLQIVVMSAAGGGRHYVTRQAWGAHGDSDW